MDYVFNEMALHKKYGSFSYFLKKLIWNLLFTLNSSHITKLCVMKLEAAYKYFVCAK